jgi:PAS domain S-box-containing protein
MSIQAALILSLLARLVICAFLFGLAWENRLKSDAFAHTLVAVAFLAGCLRGVAQVLASQGHPGFILLGDLFYVAFITCIWLGVRSYIHPLPFRPLLLALPAALACWVVAAHGIPVPEPWRTLPEHLAGMVLLGLSGLHFLRLRRERPFWVMLFMAILLWAEGINTGLYPFTHTTRWAPFGFYALVCLGIAIGLAFVIGSLHEEQYRLSREVDRRRQIEASLRTSEARFRWAMEATSDGLWDWDVASGQVYYSPAYLNMLGFGPGEWTGRLESWVTIIHPDDRNQVEAANQACIDGEVATFEVEYRLRTKAGSYKWVLGRGKAVERGADGKATRMLGTHVDIDLRKQQELELRRVNRLYNLLSQLGLSLVRVATRQELLDEFCRIAVQSGEYPLVWVGWADLATGLVAPVAAAGAQAGILGDIPIRIDRDWQTYSLVGTCIRKERPVVSQDLRRTPGYAPWMALAEAHGLHASAAFPLRLRGRVVGAFQVYGREPGCLCDQEVRLLEQAAGEITFGLDRFEMEAERADLQSQILHTQRMESLGTLAGGIAHDMNNVLGAILGLASASLEQQPEGSATCRTLDTIIKAATRGSGMVKSLLRFARRTPGEERPLDLNELVGDVIKILERTTLARVQLEVDLAPDLRPVRGDASGLTNALMNLCVNAVDAIAGKGGLTIRTRNLGPDRVEVTVADTGCGMTAEVLRRAMEPFYTTKPQGKGTGLGLPMVCSTVQAHRGQVEIRSEPGQGTSVVLRFPAAPASDPGAGAGGPPAETGGTAAGLKVLVVDDDELVRASLACLLEAMGHTCELAQSGEDALARIEGGARPDVVVLDLNMPGLGGAGTLPRLRTLEPQVPVLVATGRADQAALDLVASDPRALILEKPFTLEVLRGCLERAGALRGISAAGAPRS